MKKFETRPPTPIVNFRCPKCASLCEFPIDSSSSMLLQNEEYLAKCHSCLSMWKISRPSFDQFRRGICASPIALQPSLNETSSDSNGSGALTRGKGSDYYDILGVTKDATGDQIKRAYYKLAMKHHPDKYQGPDTLENEEIFKLISEAYQILSNDSLRERYDRYGREDQIQPNGGFADPEKFFRQMFGGDLFVDLIGELSISRDFGDVMAGLHQKEQDDKENSHVFNGQSVEERELKRKERIVKLTQNLLYKIEFYVNNPAISTPYASLDEKKRVQDEFEKRIRDEAEELKNASYGLELLHSIGYMYTLKSRQWIGKEETIFGIGKFWNDIREKSHVISETFGAIKSAVELQATLSRLEQHEQSMNENQSESQPSSQQQNGSSDMNTNVNSNTDKPASGRRRELTAEEKSMLEQKAAQKGMDTLWKGSKIEIEGVIRDVCDVLLSGSAVISADGSTILCSVVDKETVRRRANALRIIGKIYEDIKGPVVSDHFSAL